MTAPPGRPGGAVPLFSLLALVFLWAQAACGHAAPQSPATMVFVGQVAAGQLPPAVKPRPGDAVLVFAAADGRLAGHGLIGTGGEYLAAITRTTAFNGQSIVFEMQQGRRRYALLLENGAPAALRFDGRLLPERTLLSLRTGAKTAELTAAEAATPGAQRLALRTDLPCDALADVNEDGRCDEADLRILRLYGGGITRSVANP